MRHRQESFPLFGQAVVQDKLIHLLNGVAQLCALWVGDVECSVVADLAIRQENGLHLAGEWLDQHLSSPRRYGFKDAAGPEIRFPHLVFFRENFQRSSNRSKFSSRADIFSTRSVIAPFLKNSNNDKSFIICVLPDSDFGA